MPTGRIKYYNSDKGFGFIAQDSGEADVFLHASAIKRWEYDDLRVGQRVKYDVVEGKKGLVAQNVEVLLTPIERRWLRQGKAIIPRDYSGPLSQNQEESAEVSPSKKASPPPKPSSTASQPTRQPKMKLQTSAPSAETALRQTVGSDTPQATPPILKTTAVSKAKPKPTNRPTFGDLYIQKQIQLQTQMFFGLYNHLQFPTMVSKLGKYTFTLQNDGEDQEFPKTDVKYCYKAEDAKRIQSLMRYDEGIKAQKLGPVIPRKERYQIDTQAIWQARKDRYPIEVTVREGEIFRGLVDWVSPYEIKMILENGAKVVVFRHAICDFKAFPSEDRKTEQRNTDKNGTRS